MSKEGDKVTLGIGFPCPSNHNNHHNNNNNNNYDDIIISIIIIFIIIIIVIIIMIIILIIKIIITILDHVCIALFSIRNEPTALYTFFLWPQSTG